MFKKMKGCYDTEFYEISKDLSIDSKKEEFYSINENENAISFNVLLRSILIFNLGRLESAKRFNVRWDDYGFGYVKNKKSSIVGTIAKIEENKYFLLLRRMNFYA